MKEKKGTCCSIIRSERNTIKKITQHKHLTHSFHSKPKSFIVISLQEDIQNY